MEKELGIKELNEKWKQLFDALEKANEAFNDFVSAGLSVSDSQRVKPFMKKWDNLKEQCETFYDEIDRRVNATIEPVEIELPWKSKDFEGAWQYWKEYLREQHHVFVRSRAEKKMLARLKKISEGDEQRAIEYLDYAEGTLYRMFFKVTEKEYTKAPKGAERSDDGDF